MATVRSHILSRPLSKSRGASITKSASPFSFALSNISIGFYKVLIRKKRGFTNMKLNNKKSGFTLAEVLVTLMIGML